MRPDTRSFATRVLLVVGVAMAALAAIDQQSVDVPPALQLAALAIAGATMGTMGIVLGAPLTAVLFVLVQRFYVEDALGDDVDAPLDEPRVRAA